jgi:hypothetical protein
MLQRHWIPPWALVAGQLAHGVSWVLLLVLAASGTIAVTLATLGWLHLVVLGWITLTALAVLLHVIPQFTDAEWIGEGFARGAISVYAAGVVALVAAFWTGSVALLPWAGAVVVLALAGYLIPAGRTLVSAFRAPPREAAIARALAGTLASLAIAALLGFGLAAALAGHAPAALLGSTAPIHATFGIIGWLTVLIMGVSMRTIRPITGAASRVPAAHIGAGVLEIVGVAALVVGAAMSFDLEEWMGLIAMLVGALVYAGDLVDVLRRATVRHRPPQAFVAAAVLWLIVGLAFGVAFLAGVPCAPVVVYVLVIGWIAQMVNGHIYHIGIRLVATMARGDDDETPPGELLVLPLSWISFGLFQIAVVGGATARLLSMPILLEVAATAGLAGWVAMMTNVAVAVRRALLARR